MHVHTLVSQSLCDPLIIERDISYGFYSKSEICFVLSLPQLCIRWLISVINNLLSHTMHLGPCLSPKSLSLDASKARTTRTRIGET